MIADSAFKRVQVDARACWLDAGEPHRGLAFRTGGATKGGEWNDGRQELRLGHDASLDTGGSTTLSVTGNAWGRSGDCRSMRLRGSQTRVNSRVLEEVGTKLVYRGHGGNCRHSQGGRTGPWWGNSNSTRDSRPGALVPAASPYQRHHLFSSSTEAAGGRRSPFRLRTKRFWPDIETQCLETLARHDSRPDAATKTVGDPAPRVSWPRPSMRSAYSAATPSGRDVAQRLLDDMCQQRTGRQGDGWGPALKKSHRSAKVRRLLLLAPSGPPSLSGTAT
jgi:hypothetical protein